ncbi:hypothetical protein ABID95_003870 [Streptomyces atratus]
MLLGPAHHEDMPNTQQGSTTGKRRASLAAASVCLFVLGSVEVGLYAAELITDGERYFQMLESACVLLFGSWITGAVHLRRGRTEKRRDG